MMFPVDRLSTKPFIHTAYLAEDNITETEYES